MKKLILGISLHFIFYTLLVAQIDARMFFHPDVSQTQITFAYGGDIWIVNKTGGVAYKLSSPSGPEIFPRFSPDGSKIAFSGNYDGNIDVYSIPVKGGIPQRLTWHGYNDFVIDWHPNGEQVLFASSRESGRLRFSQLYLASAGKGLPQKLPLAHAEYGTFSPDGKKIAFTDKSRLNRTWKRYRGGMAPDIWLFDLENYTSEKIAENVANDELPMWFNNKIYFLSDRGESNRFNIWEYNLDSKSLKQVTNFTDVDVHYPSIGPEDIVFEAGGMLYLLNLSSLQYKEVKIQVVTDQLTLNPKTEKVSKLMQHGWISPDGKRAVIEARGDLFSVPAENGYIKNITQTSGVADRYPAWAPDGKKIAFWSDLSGEYELTLFDPETGVKTTLTNYGPGFRYQLYWSPDSKKLAFVDQEMKIKVFNTETKITAQVDQGLWMTHGALENFKVNWSSDSRWLTYSRGMDNRSAAVFLFDIKNNTLHKVTSEFYNNNSPVFDPEGKYLFVITDRHFSPSYSNFDNSFIYANSSQIAAISLRKDVESPVAPENDEVSMDKKEKENGDSEKEKDSDKKKKDKKEGDKESEEKEVKIDLAGFEERMVLLPVEPGNYNSLQAVAGKVIFHSIPDPFSPTAPKPVKYYDLKEREEKTIVEDADFFLVSANGEKALTAKGESLAIVDVKADQKADKKLPVQDMEMLVDPKAEWKQIFNDAWRLQRDYFYDKGMHGVDWNAMRTQYGKLIDDAVTRDDVNFILGELIAELNASHTYRGGGDNEESKKLNVGYLGINWEIANGYFRIKEIINGAAWDAEARSPFVLPGVEVKKGDYILAVNGKNLDITKEPFAGFQGLGGKTVELLVNSSPTADGAKKVIVTTLDNENRLRHLAWIENNRALVDKATGGKAGYIYVRSTGIDGQNELVRQFYGQWNKPALIIDERFNSGGQIPDRFIELLNRKPLAYWAVRDGKDWQWPPIGNFGPKVMLINGWSGSGGDAFPDYFRKAGLGPLIGTRTWGGLIGISGVPQLIDGGGVTVPTFRMYDPNGDWFKEGHGVDPDIEVWEDPTNLANGTDPQLKKAIEVINEQLENNPYTKPEHPAYEKR
ncbi:MAG: PD40 domain-containing protein [Bacteroidales bacterium]|nr:PD40 domain-containing protein [Bacteroidales bacterium]